MGFMAAQIEQGDYIEIDGDHGSTFIPADIVGALPDDSEARIAAVRDYYEGSTINEVTEHKGKWGARLSADGYMDCTEWSVYDTEAEAKRALCEEHDLCPICLESVNDDCSDNPACRFHHVKG